MKFRRIEMVMMVLLVVLLLSGWYIEGESEDLSGQLLRLHVVANSNSEQDQQLKLQVKEAVFDYVSDITQDAEDRQQAEKIVTEHMQQIISVAENTLKSQGSSQGVTAAVETVSFPTKYYEGFALPAGEYRSLQIRLGAGEGENWWCVLFPPMCSGGIEQADALEQDQLDLISGSAPEYRVKFKLMELLGKIFA